MYVLIGGAGMMGLNLAQKLLEMGHTVAIVDTDPLTCRYAREKVGVMAFEGSAVSTTVLIEAGIRKADSVAATLSSDALNLALVTLAKHYGVPHILTRMSEPDFTEPYHIAGASHVVSTMELAVTAMANAIEYPQVESMMHFEQGQVEVLKLPVPGYCYIVGRTVSQVVKDTRFPKGSLIIGYQCHSCADLVIPNGSTVLQEGSTILVVTKPALVHQMIDFMGIQTNRLLVPEVARSGL